MALTLTVSDNADGTGGVATIAGSTIGTTNTLYRAAVTGDLGAVSFTSTGTRTGDGTIPITDPASGYYWWYVSNSNAGVVTISNLVYQRFTDATDSVRKRCRDAIVSQLTLLALDGIGSRVFGRPIYDEQTVSLPCALVTYQDTPDQLRGGTNQRDDRGIPIQVFLLTESGLGADAPDGKYTLWRQSAERCFINQRLSGVDEVYTCEIEPAVIFERELPKYSRVVSAFTVRCVTREVRGFGA